MSNQEAAQRVSEILDTLDILLGPNGCPWDRAQTYESLRSSLLEEAYEVLDALDHKDIHNLKEELGDLLFNVLFLGKIAQKEKHFTLEQMLSKFHEKILSRHPHIFGDEKVESLEEVRKVWEKVKKEEKKERTSPFEGIPTHLPALSKAQKMAKYFEHEKREKAPFQGKQELQDLLWEIAYEARKQGLDAESALREKLALMQSEYKEK